MTCIVGVVDGASVVIGGDSAGVGGLNLTVRADEKVFALGEFVIGFTTSFRMGQVLRYKFAPPAMPEGIDLFAYMVTHFVDAVRDALKAAGFAEKDKEAESGGTFLVGIRGRLFCIQSDYQVAESRDTFQAVGCGDNVARGAMYATDPSRLIATQGAEERIRTALSAAERFSAGVRAPFVIVRTPQAAE